MSKPMSLPKIKELCTEDGDCLIWGGSLSRSGAPVRRYRDDEGRGVTLQIRRRVWELTKGPIPSGKVVTYACNNPLCLEHLCVATRGEVIERQWQRPDTRARLLMAATKASRARSKIDLEKAREVRESQETLLEVSTRLGISTTTASLIRRGLAWKETISNPFSGLIASNDSRKAA